MKYMRFSAWVATAGLVTLLSGCVVAPIGPRPVAAYPAVYPSYPAVYVEPAPVLIVPAFRFGGPGGA
jgi:hypothetical protein